MRGKPRRILLQPRSGSNKDQRLNADSDGSYGVAFLAAYGEAAGALARSHADYLRIAVTG